MNPITDKQQAVLDAIKRYIVKHGIAPARQDICDMMNYNSPNAATGHLEALERKGYINIIKSKARGITITKKGLES